VEHKSGKGCRLREIKKKKNKVLYDPKSEFFTESFDGEKREGKKTGGEQRTRKHGTVTFRSVRLARDAAGVRRTVRIVLNRGLFVRRNITRGGEKGKLSPWERGGTRGFEVGKTRWRENGKNLAESRRCKKAFLELKKVL